MTSHLKITRHKLAFCQVSQELWFYVLSGFSTSILFCSICLQVIYLWGIFQISSPDFLLFIYLLLFFAQNFNLIQADVNYSPSRNAWMDKNSEGKNKIVVVWVSRDLLAARSSPMILIRTVKKTRNIQSIGEENVLWWNNESYNEAKVAFGSRCTCHLWITDAIVEDYRHMQFVRFLNEK